MNTKSLFLSILILFVGFQNSSAQNADAARALIEDGVKLHDQGKFEDAILKYNAALEADKDNAMALYEKSYSLIQLGKYDAAVEISQYNLKVNKGSSLMRDVYVNMGNAYDMAKQPEKSLDAYTQGIENYPDYYFLYFNKAVTLAQMDKLDESEKTIQKALKLNPKHPGSHNLIARLNLMNKRRVPAMLALCRFMALENGTKRAEENYTSFIKQINKNVSKTSSNALTITLDAAALGDSTGSKENDFSSVELMLSLNTAIINTEKLENIEMVKKIQTTIDAICSSLGVSENKNKGFYWEYYAPYFIDMKKNNHTETFAYIIYVNSDDDSIGKWLKKNDKKLEKFFEWNKKFVWTE